MAFRKGEQRARAQAAAAHGAESPDAAADRWQIWVDTGGTFTDCLAVDPAGCLHRAKVLSTSALRGTVEGQPAPDRLLVRVPWDVPPDFIKGFRFRLLSSAPGPAPGTSRSLPGVRAVPRPGRRTGTSSPQLTVRSFAPGDPAEIEVEDRELGASQPRGAQQHVSAPFHAEPGHPFEVVSPEEAPVLAARLVTRTTPGGRLPPVAFRLATTLATNALLERRIAPVALFLTRGFGDLLEIGTQQRPDLFALEIRKSEPLWQAVVEVPERISADGSVRENIDLEALRQRVAELAASGVRVAAVALLHAYRNPAHEEELARFLLEEGFRHVSRSSELAHSIGILARAETCLVNACLAPTLSTYLERVAGALGRGPHAATPRARAHRSDGGGGTFHVMTSTGGLARADTFKPKDGLLSGPAGGVLGAALAGRRSGFSRIIAFDMGGTSTDVARFDGDFDYRFEQRVGGAHLVAPALAIETVASGGGSICALERDELQVGPRSSGADPGPACYAAGGPLTLTDVNLLLGRLDAGRFEIPIDAAPASLEMQNLRGALERRTGEPLSAESLLAGLLDLANERMAEAIRRISLREGYDPTDYALVAFGGAGGQHACGVAGRMGVTTIVIPPDPGLLSTWGLGNAALEAFAERQVLELLERVEGRVAGWIEELSREARVRIESEGATPERVRVRRRMVALRFAGQDSSLIVEVDERSRVSLRDAFARRYKEVFGHAPEDREIELESLRVVAEAASEEPPSAADPPEELSGRAALPAETPPSAPRAARAFFGGRWHDAAVHERVNLTLGHTVRGPALVFERHSATVVEEDWSVTVDGAGALVMRRGSKAAQPPARSARDVQPTPLEMPEAVRVELFTQRLRSVAGEMGEILRRTALSTNVRERLDFSCALLDGAGQLVVNAPHIPVHLGALGVCVRAVRDALPLEPGDAAVTNHPAFGGSHLPDVSVITPVHAADGRLLGYAANRAHHAEIGGIRPGSMPPFASRLVEEGVVIPPIVLVRGGQARWDDLRRLLREAPYPSRAIEENVADVRAAVAAAYRGAAALRALAREHGTELVERGMEALATRAEQRLREALERLPRRTYRASGRLDDGSPLAVRIQLDETGASIDFTGSAGVHPGNLNATPAVVRSVVMYVLRLLVREPLPLNEGLMRAVSLTIPQGILNPLIPSDPAAAPAVAGGNVETSQRLVDVLLEALGLLAGSQGTMNNVLFGNERFGYYETVCGGCGAGPGFHGASAVHSHMTNTRITDPEVLEQRFPVRLERFAIRRGSGGGGRWRGGDGAVRELTFLEPLSLSILSQRRSEGPRGLEGGKPGAPGRQRVVRASGDALELGAIDGVEVATGDRLVLETPGGGGCGRISS